MDIETQPNQTTEIRPAGHPVNLRAGMEPLRDLARRFAQLDEALISLAELGDAGTTRSVGRLRKQLDEFEPSITFLGQVKSGKTSLVNAMAGWADLLPSDVNPWTSVVTSLHLVPGDEPIETGARFQFMTEDEWDHLLVKGGRIGELAGRIGSEGEVDKIRQQVEEMREKSRARLGKKFELLLGQEHSYGFFDKNLVERYICLGDDFGIEEDDEQNRDQGRFADITKSADLYMKSKSVPVRLCLRDTPGVNDTFMMREQITIQAVRDSRLCVVVLSAHQALTSVDMGLIRLISNLQSREMLIFVNRIDELSDPVNQIPEIEASIRQTLQDHHGPADAQIVFGSAYWANRVLSGNLDDMAPASADALKSWANAPCNRGCTDQKSTVMTWQLSGLPAVFDWISDRVVGDAGQKALNRVAGSAITLAGGLRASEAILIKGGSGVTRGTMYETMSAFDQLAQNHAEALGAEMDNLIADYCRRTDRAHGNFVQRATHSLITYLEKFGDGDVWEYSPAGLRMLLRTAYTVFGSRVQTTARKRYEAAVSDLAVLYAETFGAAVEGIEIALPQTPDIPPPVVLGQTIALDFRDGWWTAWWRRTRGYKAFARKFQNLICAETETVMTQLKVEQTDEIKAAVLSSLNEYMVEQRDVISGIGSRATGRTEDVQAMFHGSAETRRRKALDSAMETLSRCAA